MNQTKPVAPSQVEAAPAERREIALGGLDGYIGYHLRMAQAASFRAFQKKTGRRDLTPGWFALLSLIADNPGITPIALSRASGRDKSTLSPLLRDLIAKGFVERQPIARDRRSYALFLTPSGRECLSDLAAHAARHDARLDEIAGPLKAELLDLLRRIASELD